MEPKTERPEIRVRPHGYQPTKAELEETVRIDMTPDDLARALFRQIRVVKDDNA